MRAFVVAAAVAVLIGGCSSDKVAPPQSQASSEEILKKDCNDPKWKEQNLGLWYSVCRKPLNW